MISNNSPFCALDLTLKTTHYYNTNSSSSRPTTSIRDPNNLLSSSDNSQIQDSTPVVQVSSSRFFFPSSDDNTRTTTNSSNTSTTNHTAPLELLIPLPDSLSKHDSAHENFNVRSDNFITSQQQLKQQHKQQHKQQLKQQHKQQLERGGINTANANTASCTSSASLSQQLHHLPSSKSNNIQQELTPSSSSSSSYSLSPKSHFKMSAASRRRARSMNIMDTSFSDSVTTTASYNTNTTTTNNNNNNHTETLTTPPSNERRRNFAFMRSNESFPLRRKKVSSAVMEKTRAHAKKLAKLATTADNNDYGNFAQFDQSNIGDGRGGIGGGGSGGGSGEDGGWMSSPSMSPSHQHTQYTFSMMSSPTDIYNRYNISPDSPDRKPSLNFAAFESDSVVSSVYEFDYLDHSPSFDDGASSTSFFSSASTSNYSAVTNNSHLYNINGTRNQYSTMGIGGGGSVVSGVHNLNTSTISSSSGMITRGKSKNKLEMYNGVGSMRNLQLQQQHHNNMMSPSSIHSMTSPTYQQQSHQHQDNDILNRSTLSHASTTVSQASNASSTISGAAARRLMRRGLSQNQQQMQQQQIQQQQMQQQLMQQQQMQQQQMQQNGKGHFSRVNDISPMSDVDGSQYAKLETPQKERLHKQQSHHHQNQVSSQDSHKQQQQHQHYSKSMSSHSNNTRNNYDDKRPPLSPVPYHQSGSSNSNTRTDSKKKKMFIESSTGFTFDAFGLDATEIDNEVNEALKQMEESNLDLSLFSTGSEDASSGSEQSPYFTKQSQQLQPQQQQKQKQQQFQPQSKGTTQREGYRHMSVDSNNKRYSDEKKPVNSILKGRYNTESMHDISSHNNISNDENDKSADKSADKSMIKPVIALSEEYFDRKLNASKTPIKSKALDRGFFVDAGGKTPGKESIQKEKSALKADFGGNSMHNEPKQQVKAQIDLDARNVVAKDSSRLETENVNKNDDTSSSNDSEEPQLFQPRRPPTNFQPMSEAQKRAKEWASQRTSPIVVSPLLVPKKPNIKKETTSHKRAKEWATEAPTSPRLREKMRTKNNTQQEQMANQSNYSPQRMQYEESWREATQPPPPPTESPPIETHPSANKTNFKSSYRNNPRPSSQPKVLSHREKAVLRSTDSFNDDKVDYGKFKSAAPTVPLRKVAMPPRPSKSDIKNSFLGVTLRKTDSPIIQTSSPSNLDEDEIQEDEQELYPEEEMGDLQEFSDELNQNDVILQQPKALPPKSKLSYREQREKELQMEEAKRAAKTEKEEQGPDVEAMIRRRIAANKQKLGGGRKTSTLIDEKNNDLDISNIRSILRPVSPREPEVIQPEVTNQLHIDSLRNKLRPVEPPKASGLASPTLHDSKNLSQNFSNANVTHDNDVNETSRQKLGNLQQYSQYDGEDTLDNDNVSDTQEQPSINNISELFAKKSGMVNQPSEKQSKVKALESRHDERSHDMDMVDQEKPSIDNISALFQQRADMMKKPTPKKKVEPSENYHDFDETPDSMMDNNRSNLMQMLAKRFDGPDTLDNGKMITVGDAENDDLKAKGGINNSLKDDPKYAKYFKMLKMGLPMEVVKHAMTRDGLDPSVMNGDHEKPIESEESGLPLKEDPKYAKYFKMLKMGLPMGAVKNALERDGLDPSVMDNNHNLPASCGSRETSGKNSAPLPKDKYRRTRLHWDTLRQVRSTSVWALVNQDPDVEQIEIDENEFAELFQSEMGSNVAKESEAKKKNAVKVIDPKRANNGGIVLARLKVTYEEMALAIDRIDETAMTLEQTQGLVEYIPNKEEKIALRKYMTSSNKDSADAFDELCECEKFMVAMMTVKHSKEKIRALLFKLQFKQCIDELTHDVKLIEKSCDELRNSVRLRKLLGIVLNIGNRLNTAGPTRKGKAGAFTIQSLLKLSQAKAFDKKTTFLHYIVMVVKRNDESLVKFKDDILSVLKADKVYWDQCEGDLEEVENQLENVRKIALHEVYGKKRQSRARHGKGKDDDYLSQESMTLEAEVETLRSTSIGLFTLNAIKIVSDLRENVERTKRKFVKLLEYFGEEDKKKMNPHELFQIIVKFIRDFDGAYEEVCTMEKQKRKSTEKRKSAEKSVESRDSTSTSTPTSETKRASYRQQSKTPNRPLRASTFQPHVSSPKMSSKDSESIVTTQASVGSPMKQVQPHNIIQYTMVDKKPSSPVSPNTFDEVISRNITSKTTVTTESFSDSESQTFQMNTEASDDSKNEVDENNEITFPIDRAKKFASNQYEIPQHVSDPHPIDEGFDEIMGYSRGNVHNHHSTESQSKQMSYDIKEKSEDHQPSRQTLDRQSLRNKARAMRAQRLATQKSSSSKILQERTLQSQVSAFTSDDMPFLSSSAQANKNDSHHRNLERPRPKPPSPEDFRPRSNSNSESQLQNPQPSTLSTTQERLRARRERMERRRRMISS